MRRTYLDTGVLIEAAAGRGPKAGVAIALLKDPNRVLLFRAAFREASRSPVSGIDALHVAAAHLLKADEFITTEKPGKAIYRNTLVPVVYLRG